MIDGKKILITGGTGSFGGTAAERFLARDVAEIRIFSRDEEKQDRMRRRFDDPRLSFRIGDVRDGASVSRAMEGVDLVFHAAALKQVPSCEDHPDQAVLTNVLGSQNVIEAAIARGVERVVCLSTDKAVEPVNAMGMTKALMERLVRASAKRSGRTVLCCVRYGNVLYSRGSVVPVFVEQALAGRPLTITAPGMTRFLILLEEAVGLVEEALVHGEAGDVLVLRSPAATVADLAQAVGRLLGVEAPARIIGVRPGEKIHETLATREELARSEDFGRGYRLKVGRGVIDPEIGDYTSEVAARLDVAGIMALLQKVPEIRTLLARAA